MIDHKMTSCHTVIDMWALWPGGTTESRKINLTLSQNMILKQIAVCSIFTQVLFILQADKNKNGWLRTSDTPLPRRQQAVFVSRTDRKHDFACYFVPLTNRSNNHIQALTTLTTTNDLTIRRICSRLFLDDIDTTIDEFNLPLWLVKSCLRNKSQLFVVLVTTSTTEKTLNSKILMDDDIHVRLYTWPE